MESIKKLRAMMESSRRSLKPFRENRMKAIRAFVGKNYSEDGAEDKRPVNLLELAIGIYRRNLIARRPQVIVTSRVKELKATATLATQAMNHMLRSIEIQNPLKRLASEAMFSMGIAKVAMQAGGYVQIDNHVATIGQPYCEVVDLDDWVHDMTARCYDQIRFCGDRYRRSKKFILESGLYTGLSPDKLYHAEESSKTRNPEGDARPQAITLRDRESSTEEDDIELWDIWTPEDNVVRTFIAQKDLQESPIREIEWSGPAEGPYSLLRFNEVPGSVMPLPPVSILADLDDLANRLFRKLGRQAERQKTFTAVRSGATRDGQQIVDVNDGEVKSFDDPRNFAQIASGGIDQANFAFFLQCRDLFSYFGGNLDSLGGLSTAAETFGQEKLIAASSSQRIKDMQDDFSEFVQVIIKKLSWFLYHDPDIQIPITVQVKGAEKYGAAHIYTEYDRAGAWEDYNFEVVPYSMQYLTPGERVQSLSTLLQQFLLPAMPQLEAEGMAVDIQKFLRLYSEYTNLPELEDLVVFSEPSITREIGQRPERMPKPSQTTRTYERVNRPGATRSGKDQIMMQALLGSKPQAANVSAMSRPVS